MYQLGPHVLAPFLTSAGRQEKTSPPFRNKERETWKAKVTAQSHHHLTWACRRRRSLCFYLYPAASPLTYYASPVEWPRKVGRRKNSLVIQPATPTSLPKKSRDTPKAELEQALRLGWLDACTPAAASWVSARACKWSQKGDILWATQVQLPLGPKARGSGAVCPTPGIKCLSPLLGPFSLILSTCG